MPPPRGNPQASSPPFLPDADACAKAAVSHRPRLLRGPWGAFFASPRSGSPGSGPRVARRSRAATTRLESLARRQAPAREASALQGQTRPTSRALRSPPPPSARPRSLCPSTPPPTPLSGAAPWKCPSGSQLLSSGDRWEPPTSSCHREASAPQAAQSDRAGAPQPATPTSAAVRLQRQRRGQHPGASGRRRVGPGPRPTPHPPPDPANGRRWPGERATSEGRSVSSDRTALRGRVTSPGRAGNAASAACCQRREGRKLACERPGLSGGKAAGGSGGCFEQLSVARWETRWMP